MNKYFYAFGASAVALSVVGVPALAVAQTTAVPTVTSVMAVPTVVVPSAQELIEDAEEFRKGATGVSVGDVQIDTDVDGSTSVRAGDVQVNTSATGASVRAGNVRVSSDEEGRADVQVGDVQVRRNSVTVGSMRLDFEDDADTAVSLKDLKQKIEARKQELEQEVASTTDNERDIVENANPVRLAVHSLLASKDLLGGIGSQVSAIAKAMNDSVATTTLAEEKIQSRGFFTRLLFGGDRSAADTISETVAQNHSRIDNLTNLLGQANVSADIRSTLEAHMTALEDAQTRLQNLAQSQKRLWGIFSWRF